MDSVKKAGGSSNSLPKPKVYTLETPKILQIPS